MIFTVIFLLSICFLFKYHIESPIVYQTFSGELMWVEDKDGNQLPDEEALKVFNGPSWAKNIKKIPDITYEMMKR